MLCVKWTKFSRLDFILEAESEPLVYIDLDPNNWSDVFFNYDLDATAII